MLEISLIAHTPVRYLLLTAIALSAAAASPAATALTISGSPSNEIVIAGNFYSFKPNATDTKGKTMVFRISNKPFWASFSTTTGHLSGTPGTGGGSVGNYYNIGISVSDGTSTAALKPFHIQVEAKDKSAPVLSGTPPTSVTPGSPYKFQPIAKGTPGNPLYFIISGKPAWATFNIANGSLTGTPTRANLGTYGPIRISASDNQMTGALQPFSITVKAASPSQARVYWTQPTANTNGTALTNLAGYRLHYGTSPSKLSAVVQVSNAAETSYTVSNLTAATWYFGITAYTTTGVESAMSPLVSKVVN